LLGGFHLGEHPTNAIADLLSPAAGDVLLRGPEAFLAARVDRVLEDGEPR